DLGSADDRRHIRPELVRASHHQTYPDAADRPEDQSGTRTKQRDEYVVGDISAGKQVDHGGPNHGWSWKKFGIDDVSAAYELPNCAEQKQWHSAGASASHFKGHLRSAFLRQLPGAARRARLDCGFR